MKTNTDEVGSKGHCLLQLLQNKNNNIIMMAVTLYEDKNNQIQIISNARNGGQCTQHIISFLHK